MYKCEACGKEMEHDEQYCEECKATFELLGEKPVQKPAPAPAPTQRPVTKKSSSGDAKKGHGPALASLVLGIIAFVIIGLISLVLSAVKETLWATLTEAFEAEFNGFVASTPEEVTILNTFATGMKIAFGVIHFGSGGIFLLIGIICDIVAICKYYTNTAEDKEKSTIVFAYIGLAFLVAAIIIAAVGTKNYAAVVDSIMAPYLG